MSCQQTMNRDRPQTKMRLRSGIKVLHNLPVRICRSRDTVDESGGAVDGVPGSHVHDESRDELLLVRVGEVGPGGAGVGAVDGDLVLQGAVGDRRRDAGCEFTSEVEQKCLGATVLVALRHVVVLVVAQLLEVRALFWHAHGEGGRVRGEGGDKGEHRRVGVLWA